MKCLIKKIAWLAIGLSAVMQPAMAGAMSGGTLSTPKTVLRSSGEHAKLQVNFSDSVTGDLYLIAQIGESYLFITEQGVSTESAPFRSNQTYSGEISLLDISTDTLTPGKYILYQLTTSAGGDPLNAAAWAGSVNLIHFSVGENVAIHGDRDGDGFADDDLNKDGFHDDDQDQDGYHDDDLNKDGYHDDDLNQDGYHDDDLNQDGYHDNDLDKDGFDDNDVNRDGFVDEKDAEATQNTAAAIAKISAYAESSDNPEPIEQDYFDANVESLPEGVLAELNQAVDALDKGDADTVEEIKAIVKKVLNTSPAAISDKMYVNVYEDPAELTLTAFDDDDGDTLTYSIVDEPQYGKIELVGSKVTYTPNNTDYLGEDYFTFKVNDGVTDSTKTLVTVILSDETLANRSTGGERYIIWFNGTSEDYKHNKHLFSGLSDKEYTVMKGWAVSPLKYPLGFTSYSELGASVSGVVNDPYTYKIINDYINERLSATVKSYIYGSKSLMIGGFSRGGAVFVPYFLKNIDSFLPDLKATTASGQQKELIIFLMDPVHGSKDDNDVTATMLRANQIYYPAEKEKLVEDLKAKGFSVKLIYLAAGFDYRKRNFSIDKSTYEAKSKFDYVYSAKLGISHANMSIWSQQEDVGIFSKKYKDYRNVVLDSMKYGSYVTKKFLWKSWTAFESDSTAKTKLVSAFRKRHPDYTDNQTISPDLHITRSIFRAYLNERINDPYWCDANSNCVGASSPGTITDVEQITTDYHNITEQYFGTSAADQNRGADFSINAGAAAHASYAATGNTEYQLKGHSRLGIPKEGTLKEVLGLQ